jgi:alkylation response protein AidB-like acyl-CoA dehydrogenase
MAGALVQNLSSNAVRGPIGLGFGSDRSEQMLAEIRRLGPGIARRAAEIEAARDVPRDIVDALRAIGIFRMFVPRSHNGLDIDLPSGLEICAALSRVDGSVGWTAMIGSGSTLFVPLLPRETYERVYHNGPDVFVAGSTAPLGRAVAAPGGWRISGRWPFASGCRHAEWIAGFCMMHEHGKPLRGQDGRPLVRAVLLPAGDWRIHDTWYTAGLKGTGSHDIALNDKFVPESYFFSFGTPGCIPGPLPRTVPHFLPLFLGAAAIGMAEGAIDDLMTLAWTPPPQPSSAASMRESEVFQYEVGRLAADLKAARAMLSDQASTQWRHALAGGVTGEALVNEGVQAGIWIVSTCVGIADSCFAIAGGTAVYETSPLPRRMRDLHAAAQHARIHQRQYVAGGKAVLEKYRPPDR